MRLKLFYIVLALFVFTGCDNTTTGPATGASGRVQAEVVSEPYPRGALLLSRFSSLEELKSVVSIEYKKGLPGSLIFRPQVRLTHYSHGRKVTSILTTGISEKDLLRARDGGFFVRASLGLLNVYTALNRNDIQRIELLARNRPFHFGENDIAFYDLAAGMVDNIDDHWSRNMTEQELSEKGYLNTFNHITIQAIITSVFSEKLADYIADVHERYYMPELITGHFTEEQLQDIEFGAVDNYVDIINNEWGQELGKVLNRKYRLGKDTRWTPELLANYLNDVQIYFSWSFNIGFSPFSPQDEIIVRFSNKLNTVLHEFDALQRESKINLAKYSL